MVNVCKDTLLEKYDLQIDQLDYKFIGECKDQKTLEKILIVLRSGEEGIFPDLVTFCENKLRQLAPNSRLLHLAKRILNYSDLPEEERKEIGHDIEHWSNELSCEESRQEMMPKVTSDVPPVRGKSVKIDTARKKNVPLKENVKNDRCAPRNYSEWDKFDVEKELKKLETSESNKTSNEVKKKVNKSELSKCISVSGLSEKECQYIADLEKNKGNEAFKAHDYEEAVLYYTRSLSAFQSAVTLNNRAQAYIKLKNYIAAIQDCAEVILMEPNNIKALYRRGIAYKAEGFRDLAKIDFKLILELDPENKLAKEQLKQLKQLKLTKAVNKNVVIEEIKTDESEEKKNYGKTKETCTRLRIEEANSNKVCTRLKIEEVNSNENVEKLVNLNYSSDEDDPSSHIPLKVKQMLKINPCHRKPTTASTGNVNEIEKSSVSETKKKLVKPITECAQLPVNSNINTKTSSLQFNRKHDEFVDIKIEDCIPRDENMVKSKVCCAKNSESPVTKSGNKCKITNYGKSSDIETEDHVSIDKNGEKSKTRSVENNEYSITKSGNKCKSTNNGKSSDIETEDHVSIDKNGEKSKTRSVENNEYSITKSGNKCKSTNNGKYSDIKTEDHVSIDKNVEKSKICSVEYNEYSITKSGNKCKSTNNGKYSDIKTEDHVSIDKNGEKSKTRSVENNEYSITKSGNKCKITNNGKYSDIKTENCTPKDKIPEKSKVCSVGNDDSSIKKSENKCKITKPKSPEIKAECHVSKYKNLEKSNVCSVDSNEAVIKIFENECKVTNYGQSFGAKVEDPEQDKKAEKFPVNRLESNETFIPKSENKCKIINYNKSSDLHVEGYMSKNKNFEESIVCNTESNESAITKSENGCNILSYENSFGIEVKNHKPEEKNIEKSKVYSIENSEPMVIKSENKCKITTDDEPTETNNLKLNGMNANKTHNSENCIKDENFACNFTEEKKANGNCVKDLLEPYLKQSKEDIKEYAMLQGETSYEKITPYEFLCTWWSTNAVSDNRLGAEYLLQIKPEELPIIISNKLETSVLCGLLKAIYGIYKMGRSTKGENFLHYLTQVPRIKIVSMLLSEEEIQDILSLFATLEKENGIHMKYVNKILQI